MYDLFLRRPFMSAAGLAACNARDMITAMCAFELALAQIQENTGLLAHGTAAKLAQQLRPTQFDIESLADATANGGNVAIPFVKQARGMLTGELTSSLHVGATSQDVIDSAIMLLIKPRLQHCLALGQQVHAAGADLMRRFEATPMVGRTLMQQALPITFGRKVADWLWGYLQAEQRLAEVTHHGLFVQFGGAVGVHSGLADGLGLMDALAAELDLNAPLLPWHTDRQPVLAIAHALTGMAVAAEKISLDVALMSQNEIGELSEPAAEGVGSSSSMPHKRNPVACARIRAAAHQIRAAAATINNVGAQPLERGLGDWHAEWAPLMDAVLLLEGALESLARLLAGLEVHEDAMRKNLALTGGAIMAAPAKRLLADYLDTERAATLTREAAFTAVASGRDYADVLLEDPEIAACVDAQMLREAVDPALHTGSSRAQVARLLARLRTG
ncbi:MAG: adenylosuccinate lyase family protein [Salinisphaera sp.]|jgi:3-carboxy-cis,cis-muconate cycloisomerase|nr:adenylosuccinate lyase family protein [Salinisphaera sp.]